MKQVSMAELTGKYMGRKFEECSCMKLVSQWYADIDVLFPSSFAGLTVDTYMAAWDKDKKAVINIMLDLFNSLGEPADVDHLKRHDLLAVEEKNNIYAAIYIGAGMAVTSHIKEGVKLFYIGKLHNVVMARRLIKCLK